jgi:hypothetical protein
MGILRTNEISGLETPTAVTGSVVFDGTGDYLEISPNNGDLDFTNNSFTIETWLYPIASGGNDFNIFYNKGVDFQCYWKSNTNKIEVYADSNGTSDYDILNTLNTPTGSVVSGQWTHVAIVRSGNTFQIYLNGIASGTSITSSASIGSNSYNATIGDYKPDLSKYEFNGYISNLRILKGTALYTSDFTPPVHELQPIGDTVLLCCNNPDSAAAASYAGIGTSKTITVNGDAAASTVSPGLTRDFTSGTQFQGVAKFDTQGYFVPPSGTTEQRGRGRGVFGGGTFPSPSSDKNTIDYIEIHTEGNAQDFGDLPTTTRGQGGCSSSTRGLFFSGYSGGVLDQIEFVTIHTTGNALDFGNLTVARTYAAGASSNTRGIFAGGYAHRDVIDYVTIAALGDAVDFGNLNAGTGGGMGSVQSPTRAVFAGGYVPGTKINTIQYITIASTGDAQDFGDLTNATNSMGGVSSQTRGVFTGGVISPSTIVNSMEYITIASTGNSQDFGDLVEVRQHEASASNTIRGVSAGGINPSATNAIDFVVIATTGNANSFGDLTERRGQTGGCSDSHGGLS